MDRRSPTSFASTPPPSPRTEGDPEARRLRARALLRELEPTLLESFQDGLILTDTDGVFVYASPAYCRITGFAEDELLDRSFLDTVIAEELRPEYRKIFVESIAKGKTGLMSDMQIQRRDGRSLTVNVRHSRIEQGGRAFHAFLVRDVTEQRAIERHLLRNDQMKALGTLAGGVAHEFNNILVSILGYAELIERMKPLEEKQLREFARKIQRAANRGTQLTTQLLPFTKHEQVQKRAIDFRELLEEVTELFRALVGGKIRISLVLGDEPIFVEGIAIQLHQIVLNLYLNALDAMPEGGDLAIEVRSITAPTAPPRSSRRHPPGQHLVELCVRDTGTGMTEEVRQRAFQPFYSTKHPRKGQGLGLALVYSAVENHGGTVEVESKEGVGSTVLIRLPLVKLPRR
jgi:two-component system, cell cycle sensor histidine kinase and response regulator CckA